LPKPLGQGIIASNISVLEVSEVWELRDRYRGRYEDPEFCEAGENG
jgi:hypothetical protein